MAAVLPILLWTEWILDEEQQQSGRDHKGNEESVNKGRVSEALRQFEKSKAAPSSTGSDLEAIEVALLAIYHQDLNLNPTLPAPMRLQAVGGRSLYNPTIDLSSSDQSASLQVIQPDPSHQMTQLTLTKLDAYTRPALVLRLSRFYQDHLPAGVPYLSLLAYLLLIDRLMLRGGMFDKDDRQMQTALLSQTHHSNDNEEDLSRDGGDTATIISATASLDIGKEGHNSQPLDQISLISKTTKEMLWNIFYALPQPPTKKFPILEPLVLLWSEALYVATPYLRHPLPTIIRQRLLRMAKAKLYSTAVFALGRN